MEIFKIRDLTYYYPQEKNPALKNINLSINEGEFILLLGNSGSGKTTLGRIFNKIVPEFYGGKIKGNIYGNIEVGMVFQDPERQLVMDKVERELAFGLENIGLETKYMKKRVMETLSFLNIDDIKQSNTYELSGGQKQKVAIGAMLALGNNFLVLDEPTSQLDPSSSAEIMTILKRLNDELGYTIFLIEQKIDRCFHLADRILFMENGEIVYDGEPRSFISWAYRYKVNFLPSISHFFSKLDIKDIPLNIKEGRKLIKNIIDKNQFLTSNKKIKMKKSKENSLSPIIELKKINFSYDNKKNVLNNINLTIYQNEILGLMGANGSGKTTLIKLIAGLLKNFRGKRLVNGSIGYLSQNPNDYLFNDTVYEELKFTLDNKGIKDDRIIEEILKQLDIYKYKNKNPRDLSSGEKQRVALASILVMRPDILILDEPTRGLNLELIDNLGNILLDIRKKETTIIVVTHDVEFVSKFCDRVGLIFNGEIAQIGSKYEVLTSGIYYSTQINKLFRGYNDFVLTEDDAINFLHINKGVS
ncbi:ABC transporter ATP-binding protein [Defluviitalea phaphyphila]|uniref:ABC transporter ATP-binding protein n=1 Tax=Defluviitalea phaphyphila TaxID=1473580 RepID=UPI0007313419|nr:ATP-binding cassette domain-containing protein [Defluviitalea phaphyphila]